MELLLHFGLYKTGSSFLQTVCARNRELLSKSSIFFPSSSREDDMLAGKISPGNGNGLAQLMLYKDRAKLDLLLNGWIHLAEAEGCNRILISDEALIHAFAEPASLSLFKTLVEQSGIQNVSCFAFFRDPVDHCISTFKHRAKKGAIASFEEWIENGYETMHRYRSFLDVYPTVPFKWLFRKYQRDSEKMIGSFFREWLNLDLHFPALELSVNPSLTLSEIAVIQEASRLNDRLPFHLYDRFIAIPYAQKEKDVELEQAYRAISYRIIERDMEVINRLNDVLIKMGSEPLDFEYVSPDSGNPHTIKLSRVQVNAIMDATEYSKKYHVYILDKLRFTKRKLKRKIKQYSF